MTTSLRDALNDLVTDIPRHVVPPGLAGRTWAAGRRRRWRRRAASLAMVVALAALVPVMVPPLTGDLRSPASSDAGVSGYPQRIGHQWWIRDLPDRPGPVAALVQIDWAWFAVSERGHRWRIPSDWTEQYPALSPDGRLVGYLAGREGPYVIHDLVTGEKTEFADVGGHRGDATVRYGLLYQHPNFWSPAGTRLMVSATLNQDQPHQDAEFGQLLLGVDGSLTVLEDSGQWRGHPAGWANDDALLLLSWSDDRTLPDAQLVEMAVTTVSFDGSVLWTLPLQPSTAWQGLSQWSGVVSPDGTRLLVIDEPGLDELAVRQFSSPTGRR